MKHTFLLIMLMFTHSAFSTECLDFELKMDEMLKILDKEEVINLENSYKIIDDDQAKKQFIAGTKREDLNYCRPVLRSGLASCWKVSIQKNLVCSELSHTTPALPSFLQPSTKYQCRRY